MLTPDQNPNKLCITGRLIQRDALRLTPARVPVLAFQVHHESRLLELEVMRSVSCEVKAVAIGVLAQQLANLALGGVLYLEGFLAARSAKNLSPVLHVQKFELLEGN